MKRKVNSRWLLLLFVLLFVLVGCEEVDERMGANPPRDIPDGDAELGRELLAEWGCASCHTIPGVVGADAYVGPPLDAWSKRQYIAGNLPNTPENLIFWIMNPQEVEPGTAMPDMEVNEGAARSMGAYLYTLE